MAKISDVTADKMIVIVLFTADNTWFSDVNKIIFSRCN